MQPASSDSSIFAVGRWRWGAGKQEELLEQMLCRWYTSCEAPKTDCFWEDCWGTMGVGVGWGESCGCTWGNPQGREKWGRWKRLMGREGSWGSEGEKRSVSVSTLCVSRCLGALVYTTDSTSFHLTATLQGRYYCLFLFYSWGRWGPRGSGRVI